MPIIPKLEQCFPCNTLVDTAFFRLGGALIQVNTVSWISLWCATVCEGLEHDGNEANCFRRIQIRFKRPQTNVFSFYSDSDHKHTMF